jgi:hypothetical protein
MRLTQQQLDRLWTHAEELAAGALETAAVITATGERSREAHGAAMTTLRHAHARVIAQALGPYATRSAIDAAMRDHCAALRQNVPAYVAALYPRPAAKAALQ